MKDEKVLNEIVDDISNLTGRDVSSEKKKKIVNAIMNDKVPKDVDTMF